MSYDSQRQNYLYFFSPVMTNPVLNRYPNRRANVFLMMRFRSTEYHKEISNSIEGVLSEYSLNLIRADMSDYAPQLWDTVEACMNACEFGIAVFEQIDERDINPNVSLELGYMRGQGKRCLLLKEKRVPALQSDLIGHIWSEFDDRHIRDTIEPQVRRWLKSLGIAKGRDEHLLIFVSSGGTCHCVMAKVITEELLRIHPPGYPIRILSTAIHQPRLAAASDGAQRAVEELFGRPLLANHWAMSLTATLIKEADLILAMDRSVYDILQNANSAGLNVAHAPKIHAFKPYFGLQRDIEDPWQYRNSSESEKHYARTAQELFSILEMNLSKIVEAVGQAGPDTTVAIDPDPPAKGGTGKVKVLEQKTATVTVWIDVIATGARYSCEAPLDLPIGELLPDLHRELGLPINLADRSVDAYLFSRTQSRQLDSEATLRESNVQDREILQIQWSAMEPKISTLSAAFASAHGAVQQKAVAFTHFGSLRYGCSEDDWQMRRPRYLRHYTDTLQSYLQCAKEGRQIDLVFVYVDSEIYEAAPKIRGGTFRIEATHLVREQALFSLLKEAEEMARRNLSVARDDPPRFQYIGLQLIWLLNNLLEADPQVAGLLDGLAKTFSYSSPSLVEAVIRLARGSVPHLAATPVIRIEEDATPTAGFVNRLLQAYQQVSAVSKVFLFSGRLGNPEGESDLINDYAVRTHWLANVPQHGRPRLTSKQSALARMFLADLNELGATQILDSQDYYSQALRDLLAGGRPRNRGSGSPQLIAGAGLIMSPNVIELFPPFINLLNITAGAEGVLLRRLHEAAGNLAPQDPECLMNATIKQVCRSDHSQPANVKIQKMRHVGLSQTYIEWAKQVYFDRLLRGCLFHRLIRGLDGRSTKYSSLLADIVRHNLRRGDEAVQQSGLKILEWDLKHLARERYEEVVTCWRSPELTGTPVSEWVGELPSHHRSSMCNEVAHDALRYLDLVLDWPYFISAIERLQIVDNHWLFLSP